MAISTILTASVLIFSNQTFAQPVTIYPHTLMYGKLGQTLAGQEAQAILNGITSVKALAGQMSGTFGKQPILQNTWSSPVQFKASTHPMLEAAAAGQEAQVGKVLTGVEGFGNFGVVGKLGQSFDGMGGIQGGLGQVLNPGENTLAGHQQK